VSGRTATPSGWPPPADLERYGADVARASEIHDTRYLLSWAIGDVEGRADVVAEHVHGAGAVAERLRAGAARVRSTPTFL
jgi:hypothetical protein